MIYGDDNAALTSSLVWLAACKTLGIPSSKLSGPARSGKAVAFWASERCNQLKCDSYYSVLLALELCQAVPLSK